MNHMTRPVRSVIASAFGWKPAIGKLIVLTMTAVCLAGMGTASADWTKPYGRFHISRFHTYNKHSRISVLRVRTLCLKSEAGVWHYLSYEPDYATATLGC